MSMILILLLRIARAVDVVARKSLVEGEVGIVVMKRAREVPVAWKVCRPFW
jgi:hypothetical protein